MKQLKGITWDHPRGYDSIVAATETFHELADDFQVTWDIRSLKEFGDLPIAGLTEKYDLLMIDHPFVGDAHEQQLLMPMEQLMSRAFLNEQSQVHIGVCYESYSYKGRQYALPIDGASQFSAYNPMVLSPLAVPHNWTEYLDIMFDPHFKNKVLWPLCTTDFWCSFLTIAAQLAERNGVEVFNDEGVSEVLAYETFEYLKQLTEGIPEQCWSMNPIGVLECMTNTSECGFSPLLFGYSNYGRNREGNVEFLNAISLEDQRTISLLGGVGIAVSSKTKYKNEITTYLGHIMKNEILLGAYFDAGGQPSLAEVWNSKKHSKATSNFFCNTLETMQNAYVRPCIPGFNDFQERASEFIHAHFKTQSARTLGEKVNVLFRKSCL